MSSIQNYYINDGRPSNTKTFRINLKSSWGAFPTRLRLFNFLYYFVNTFMHFFQNTRRIIVNPIIDSLKLIIADP